MKLRFASQNCFTTFFSQFCLFSSICCSLLLKVCTRDKATTREQPKLPFFNVRSLGIKFTAKKIRSEPKFSVARTAVVG